MQVIDTLLKLTRDREPWALARFNDGEMSAIARRSGKISRGAQEVTEGLAIALEAALEYRRHNYWIGLPCGRCWKKHRQEAAKRCNPKWYPHTTLAVVLTNRNHQRWQEEFPSALAHRRVTWVGPMEQKLGGLPFYDLIDYQIVVPAQDAWGFWENNSTIQPIPKGQVVLTSCGPLGRVLAHRWFAGRPDLTIIDVGSIYDPLTLGRKTARIHQGKLPPCRECH